MTELRRRRSISLICGFITIKLRDGGRTANFVLVCTLVVAFGVLTLYAQGNESQRGGRSAWPGLVLSTGDTTASLLPINVTAVYTSAAPTSSVAVPITVDDLTGNGIGSYQFNILFDPTVVTPSGANFGCSTAGTLTASAGLSAICNVSPEGTLRVAVFGAGTMAGAGTILNLTFATNTVSPPANVSGLTFQNVKFYNGAGTALAYVAHDGQITVIAPTAAGVAVGGMIINAFGRPVNNATITLANNSGLTLRSRSNSFGYYRFDDVPAGADYVLDASAKRYNFTPQMVSVIDQVLNINIIASL